MEGSPETKSPSSCLKCTAMELIRTRDGPDIYYLSFKPAMQNTFDFQILWFCYKDKQQRLIRTSKRFAHRLLHFGIEKKNAIKNTAIKNKPNNKSKEILMIMKHFSCHYFVYCFVLIAAIHDEMQSFY